MAKAKDHEYSKVQLHIFNYESHFVADFKNNLFDAERCMRMFNDDLIRIHSALPEKIFYYLTFQRKRNKTMKFSVNFNRTKGNEKRDDDLMWNRQEFIAKVYEELSITNQF